MSVLPKNEDEKYTFTTRIQKTKIDKVKVDAFTTDIDAFLLYVLNKKKFEAKINDYTYSLEKQLQIEGKKMIIQFF